jgi:hypothetical protein
MAESFLKANSHSTHQEIPCLSYNPSVYHCGHKTVPHATRPYLQPDKSNPHYYSFNFNIILLFISWSPKLSLSYAFLSSTIHASRLVLIWSSSLCNCYIIVSTFMLLHLSWKPIYYAHNFVLKHHWSMFSSEGKRPSFTSKITFLLHAIWGCHSGGDADVGLVGSNTVWTCR